MPDTAGVNGFGALLDMLHDSVFVQQERGADREAPGGVQDAILYADFPLEIAQQRKGDAEVLGKAFVAGRGIDADADDLSVVGFVMCDISLICA